MDTPPPYFTATLSQSQAYNVRHHKVQTSKSPYGVLQHHSHYVTLTDFVDYLACKYPDRLAAGSVIEDGTVESLNFSEIKNDSARTATWFCNKLISSPYQGGTVALLASSSLSFMVAWLGLIRAGYRVLLVAPQNTSATVRHLLKISQSVAICYDTKHSNLAESAVDECNIVRILLKWESLSALRTATQHLHLVGPATQTNHDQSLGTVYYFHSTGTTGKPKLIPQTHHGAVGVLPLLQDTWPTDSSIAGTFTTTPLYHGGIADLFRSWSAGAPVWLFSENTMKITGHNIVKCLETIDQFSLRTETLLANLSCVPFVLEMVIQEPAALERLKQFERVGVGGAAMQQDLGDKTVAAGVRLVSRFGSSECGFLLSSERDFVSDLGWSVLQEAENPSLFELQESDRHELVVPLAWPAVSTAEHAKRPFRTKDIFKQYATGWQYMGRADAQLTLATGKKFDPNTIESVIRRNNNIEEAVVVGEGQIQPAILLFFSQKASQSSYETQKAVAELALGDVNTQNPAHARIKRNMIRILPFTDLSRVKKDVKGGVMRSAFRQEFHRDIDALYNASIVGLDSSSSLKTIQQAITTIVGGQMPAATENVDPDRSFFEYGLDSAGYAFICSQLNRSVPAAKKASKISLSTIFQYDSILSLSKWVEDYLKQSEVASGSDAKLHREDAKRIFTITEEYASQLLQTVWHHTPTIPSRRVILLTGATGFLGANILDQLLKDSSVDKVHLIVRNTVQADSEEPQRVIWSRVESSLQQRKLRSSELAHKVVVYAADFEEQHLGLGKEEYDHLSNEVTHLIHAAWDVNFNLPLRRFRPQLQALVNLQRLLASREPTTRKRIIFCSSTAADIQNGLSDQSHKVPSTGYGQSKLVAEQILRRQSAVEVIILRIGQLCGHTASGVWNSQEAWPLMIDAGLHVVPASYKQSSSKSADVVLPDLASIGLSDIDWLPVDIAAKRIIDQSFGEQCGVEMESLTNSTQNVPWTHFQRVLKCTIACQYGKHVDFIAPMAWLDALEASAWHPAQSLIPLWRENWSSKNDATVQRTGFQQQGRELASVSHAGESLSDKILERIVKWIIGRK